MLERKTRFLIHLQRFDKTVHILEELVQHAKHNSPKSETPEKEKRAVLLNMARCYYLLGTAHLESYMLVADSRSLKLSEMFSKYAFNARHELFKNHLTADDFVLSIELCIKIYEVKKDTTSATQYRNYLPQTLS